MPRPKSNPSLETRALIVRTAKELFMELGYRAVSTRLIAKRCGLTQPALYHHFTDKESLYVEVMRHVCEGTRAALERILRREAAVRDRLYHVTYYMMANHPEDLSQMFHDIRHELSPASQMTIYALWKEAYFEPIVSIFENGQRDGGLREAQAFGVGPETAARLLMGLINQSVAAPVNGPATASATRPDFGAGSIRDWEKQAAVLVNVLLYGLSAVEPPSV
ncbi:transcriptional regulator, TetR family [Paenibacillus sp. UNC496MF]|uniref:TetR/AcrR family transcriptional regulator n=1 Tax=Paenibacillus sp. UNC496MF TaxID=1502753 RepID=UPI0008E1106D|nr:TetR/AcrR family transcriptional regulator [Paenibacillus sp. UNC496MF]SFI91445.1 transcriptional regulator, TetR family [Paenibacillus sp. UNC496MF]